MNVIKKVLFALGVLLIVFIKYEVIGTTPDNRDKQIGDICNTSKSEGTCKLIPDCPVIHKNLRNHIFNHTVCGYQGINQIICCPSEPTFNEEISDGSSTYNFSQGFDCVVNGTSAKGVVKIRSDCPELDLTADTNILCSREICDDLVCCPITNVHRHKPICQNVDNPRQEIRLRLRSNRPCTVADFNITGIYQDKCDFHKSRTKYLEPFLTDICDDDICNDWYCCPVDYTDPVDHIYCNRDASSYPHIEYIGPKCIDFKTRRPGTCRLLKNCPYQNVDNHLDRCGRNCCEDYYCCPDMDIADEPLVNQKCFEYAKYKFKKQIEVVMADPSTNSRTKCTIVSAISGGYEVTPGEYPHMAALGYQIDDEPIEFSCGGSLISERYVLTAGHCLKSKEAGDVKYVRMGVIDLRTNKSLAYDCPEDFLVSEIIPHPDYTKRSVYNDIGLIRLDRDVKFNYHIRPICLPSSPDIPTIFLAMGWGALGAADPQSLSLIQVKQELFSFDECIDVYQYFVTSRFKEGVLNDTQICAGSKTGIQSTCGGDSGGPLLYYHEKYLRHKVYTVYGIVSFGSVCGYANSPGVYTKVYPYVEWIEGIIWP